MSDYFGCGPSRDDYGADMARAENPYRDHLFVRGLSQAATSVAEGAWDEGFAAGRAAFDAVVAKRDRLASECAVCEKCGHVQAEPNWCHECGHRTTPPEWAKPLLDAWHEREGDKHLARPATEKLVSLTRERDEARAMSERQEDQIEAQIRDAGRDRIELDNRARHLAHLERALKHLREFVQDGEVRRIIDRALDGEDWDA